MAFVELGFMRVQAVSVFIARLVFYFFLLWVNFFLRLCACSWLFERPQVTNAVAGERGLVAFLFDDALSRRETYLCVCKLGAAC